jgi:hypothetical protein
MAATEQDVRDAFASLPSEAGAIICDGSSGEPVKVARRDPLRGGGFHVIVLNAEDLEWSGGQPAPICTGDLT